MVKGCVAVIYDHKDGAGRIGLLDSGLLELTIGFGNRCLYRSLYNAIETCLVFWLQVSPIEDDDRASRFVFLKERRKFPLSGSLREPLFIEPLQLDDGPSEPIVSADIHAPVGIWVRSNPACLFEDEIQIGLGKWTDLKRIEGAHLEALEVKVLTLAILDVSGNQVVHPKSGKLKSPNTSFPGDSGEHP